MRILNVEPKDIHITFDMSIKEVNLVLDALDHSEVKFASDEQPNMIEADACLKMFFKTLADISNEVKGK